jgi:hypothetical protein
MNLNSVPLPIFSKTKRTDVTSIFGSDSHFGDNTSSRISIPSYPENHTHQLPQYLQSSKPIPPIRRLYQNFLFGTVSASEEVCGRNPCLVHDGMSSPIESYLSNT